MKINKLLLITIYCILFSNYLMAQETIQKFTIREKATLTPIKGGIYYDFTLNVEVITDFTYKEKSGVINVSETLICSDILYGEDIVCGGLILKRSTLAPEISKKLKPNMSNHYLKK